MPISPPEEPLDIRGKSITPQSPKPIKLPEPSNIPLLGRQMDSSLNVTVTEDAPVVDLTSTASEYQHLENPGMASDDGLHVRNVPAGSITAETDSGIGSIDGSNVEDAEAFTEAGIHVQTSNQDQDQTPIQDRSTEIASDSAVDDQTAPTSLDSMPEATLAATVISTLQESNTDDAPVSLLSSVNPPPSGGVDIDALLKTLSPQLQSIPQTTSTPSLDNQASTVSQATILPPNPTFTTATALPSSITNAYAQNQAASNEPRPLPKQASFHPLPHALPAPILTTGANGLPPPPTASFQQPTWPLPSPTLGRASSIGGDDDGPFPVELEGPYEQFLEEERQNVNEANWERFPEGSRLFIGKFVTLTGTLHAHLARKSAH